MTVLTEDWQYPVVGSDLDPNDPLVNTASEYMFQLATINYHTITSTQTVILAEGVEYNGEFFAAGTYDVPVDGRYWTDFDFAHPLEGPARDQAWTGTVHAPKWSLLSRQKREPRIAENLCSRRVFVRSGGGKLSMGHKPSSTMSTCSGHRCTTAVPSSVPANVNVSSSASSMSLSVSVSA